MPPPFPPPTPLPTPPDGGDGESDDDDYDHDDDNKNLTPTERFLLDQRNQRAVNDINKFASQKYVFSPDFIEEKHWTMKSFMKFMFS